VSIDLRLAQLAVAIWSGPRVDVGVSFFDPPKAENALTQTEDRRTDGLSDW
jgi:hypothetical protein